MLEPIPLRDLAALGAIAADDRDELRVAARVRERGQHRDLRDVSEADDGVADRTLPSWHGDLLQEER